MEGMALEEAPAPPVFAKKQSRPKIRLDGERLAEFEHLAAGTPYSSAERSAFTDQLPMVAHVGALVPHLDQGLQSTLARNANVPEVKLIALHAGLVDALSALSVSEALLSATETTQQEKAAPPRFR